MIIDPDTVEDKAQRCCDESNCHGRQPHLRLPYTSISCGEEIRSQVGYVATTEDADKRANEPGNKAESRLPWRKTVVGGKGGCEVRRNGNEESYGDRHDQGSPENRGERQKYDRSEEDFEYGLPRKGTVEET